MKNIFLMSLPLAALAVFGTGCATVPPDVQSMRLENERLVRHLENTKTVISRMEQEKANLNSEIEKLRVELDISNREKDDTVADSYALRSAIRNYLGLHLTEVRDFLSKAVLLNRIGGHAIKRPLLDSEPVCLVDLKNRMPADGMVWGGRLFTTKPCSVQFFIVREERGKNVAVYCSENINITTPGINEMYFDSPCRVQKNDFPGILVNQPGGIPYSFGAGDTRVVANNKIKNGDRIDYTEQKTSGRTYSFALLMQP